MDQASSLYYLGHFENPGLIDWLIELLCIVTQVAPSEVVAQQAIRKAMGIVTYDEAPTTSSTEASVEMQYGVTPASVAATDAESSTSRKQQELDADINDFFTQRTADQPIVL